MSATLKPHTLTRKAVQGKDSGPHGLLAEAVFVFPSRWSYPLCDGSSEQAGPQNKETFFTKVLDSV